MDKTKYEKTKPYNNPKLLSIITPNICLSRSELNIFLILLRKNNEIRKIKGIDKIKLNILVKVSKLFKKSIFINWLFRKLANGS